MDIELVMKASSGTIVWVCTAHTPEHVKTWVEENYPQGAGRWQFKDEHPPARCGSRRGRKHYRMEIIPDEPVLS